MKQYTHRGFGILQVIVIIAVVGLLAALAWVYVTRTSNSANQNDHDTPSSEEDTLQPRDITNRIRAFYEEKYTVLEIDTNNQPKENQVSIRTHKTSPPYKVEGYPYYVSYDGGSSIDIMRPWTVDEELPSDNDREVRKEVERIFYDAGLDSTESIPDGSGNLTNYFEGNGVVCSVEAPSSATSSSSASCGLLASYPDAAAGMKPFADILEHTDGTTILSGSSKQSKSPEYKIATISVGNMQGGGATALLWKRGVGNWTLFRYVQNTPPCNAFDTNGLKTAFEGEPCYDTKAKKATTVKHTPEAS